MIPVCCLAHGLFAIQTQVTQQTKTERNIYMWMQQYFDLSEHIFSHFLPLMHAGPVSLPAASPRLCMPKWQDGATVEISYCSCL